MRNVFDSSKELTNRSDLFVYPKNPGSHNSSIAFEKVPLNLIQPIIFIIFSVGERFFSKRILTYVYGFSNFLFESLYLLFEDFLINQKFSEPRAKI